MMGVATGWTACLTMLESPTTPVATAFGVSEKSLRLRRGRALQRFSLLSTAKFSLPRSMFCIRTREVGHNFMTMSLARCLRSATMRGQRLSELAAIVGELAAAKKVTGQGSGALKGSSATGTPWNIDKLNSVTIPR